MSQNLSQISSLNEAGASRARVLSALKKASTSTGVDFSYLFAKATQESGLNPNARAKGSSATGLFQFIDQTWLKTIKAHGEEHGLKTLAEKISVDDTGLAHVASATDKARILALRTNPEVASVMAAELAQDNKECLQRAQVGDVGATELYLAHFLGVNGAKTLLKAESTAPETKAASLLPQAAAANRSVFYDTATGRAKTVAEVYAAFDKKFGGINVNETSAVAHLASSALKEASSPTSTAFWSGISGNVSSPYMASVQSKSPFSTLLLAQMDMDTFGLDALSRLGACEAYATREKAFS